MGYPDRRHFAGLRERTPVMGALRQPDQYVLRSKDDDGEGRHGAVDGGYHHDTARTEQLPQVDRSSGTPHMLHHIHIEYGIQWLTASHPL